MTILPKITLKAAVHRETEVVQLVFEHNQDLQTLLRKNTTMRWSATMNCWYLPYSKNLKQELFQLLKHQAFLDYSLLNASTEKVEVLPQPVVEKEKPDTHKELGALSEEAEKKVLNFKQWMRSKRYSENTIGTYVDALRTFLRYCSKKDIKQIDNQDLIIFNNEYILANKLSSSFQNQVVNAIKLFFRTVENKHLDPALIHRPKRAKVLPNVLSKEEVKQILGALTNVKHRMMLSLIYSCGLRRSELLNLKLKDIDSGRGLIIVRQAKGKKDRVVPLSDKILFMLRDYFTAYKPKEWLFEGQGGICTYDERSLASVLSQAVAKARINKPVTLHWLRHSYATHLLENGTDLRYIQEILGHSRSTTTEIYTHVSNKSIQKVISPFDSL